MKDLTDGFDIGMSAACQKTRHFINAVDNVLTVELPKREELKQVAIKWNSKLSAFGAHFGFLGAINGWLCCTNKPRVHNAAHHCSGHCQRHGINFQAVVDANLCFPHFGTIVPGQMNDARAFQNCTKLCKWLNDLPEECFFIGDNACPLS